MNKLLHLATNRKVIVATDLLSSATRGFHLNAVLLSEPRKKKAPDPMLVRMREEKRKKNLLKQIKLLEKQDKVLKPIVEHREDHKLMKELDLRKRTVPELTKEERNEQFDIAKEWSQYVLQQNTIKLEQIRRALISQENALNELKKDDYYLYKMAIQVDKNLIPFNRDGPCYTPPINGYEPPDGDYDETTYLYDAK